MMNTAQHKELKWYHSSTVHDQHHANNDVGFVPGLAHYSYKIALKKFLTLLSSRNIHAQALLRPEIFTTDIARSQLFSRDKNAIHLIFKPFEHVRILKKAVNIACLAWEFSEVLSSETASHDILPTQDYVRVAKAVDEIWTPSHYAHSVFQRSGITNSHVIPAPVYAPPSKKKTSANVPDIKLFKLRLNLGWLNVRLQNIQPAKGLQEIVGAARPKIFLMVFNPGDRRKNPMRAIKAFSALSKSFENAILIIKFVFDPSLASLNEIIERDISGLLDDFKVVEARNIWVTDEYLPEDSYRELLAAADFFLCTSFCEGQNLPLLEAMSAGVVPISVAHTAMADYINEKNAIVIKSYETKEKIKMSFAADIIGATWFDCADKDVYRALSRALHITSAEYDHLAANAMDAAQAFCGHAAVWDKIQRRIEGIFQ